MLEIERALWLTVIIYCSVAILAIVLQWVHYLLERRRVRRILASWKGLGHG